MKEKKCNKCKKICADCRYYMPEQDNPWRLMYEAKCARQKIDELDCVTGIINTEYVLCEKINASGDCKYFKKKVSAQIKGTLKDLKLEVCTDSLTAVSLDFLEANLYKETSIPKNFICLLEKFMNSYFDYDFGDGDYAEESNKVREQMKKLLETLSEKFE